MKHCHLGARATGPRWATNPGSAGRWLALCIVRPEPTIPRHCHLVGVETVPSSALMRANIGKEEEFTFTLRHPLLERGVPHLSSPRRVPPLRANVPGSMKALKIIDLHIHKPSFF